MDIHRVLWYLVLAVMLSGGLYSCYAAYKFIKLQKERKEIRKILEDTVDLDLVQGLKRRANKQMDKTKIILGLISIKDDVRGAIPGRLEEIRERVDQKIETIIKEVLDENAVVLRSSIGEVNLPFKPCPPIENREGDADEN